MEIEYRKVSEFGDEYDLVQVDFEVDSILESTTCDTPEDYIYLLVKVGNAEYVEIWGLEETPYLENFAVRLF